MTLGAHFIIKIAFDIISCRLMSGGQDLLFIKATRWLATHHEEAVSLAISRVFWRSDSFCRTMYLIKHVCIYLII